MILYRWQGDAMEPLPRFREECDREFVVGQIYRLDVYEERSHKSHAHYFACIADGWQNLPENLAADFPTPECLRKHALIRSGYADKRTFVASSKAEALRIAAFIRPLDEYSIVTVDGAMVTEYRAQSQSQRAMGAKTFQASKDAVLNYIAGLIGTTPATLAANAGRAA